jgi:hypothetical protein
MYKDQTKNNQVYGKYLDKVVFGVAELGYD